MLHLLITGGTIDKIYNELNGELIFTKSNIPIMLKEAKCLIDTKIETLFLKDSLEMTQEDREMIYQKVLNSNLKQILITHGTDTMVESAKFLGEKKLDKVIVFTGAMIPYSFKNSDALFNLGVAISSVQLLQNGVYIAMNGKIFDFRNVIKDKKRGIFSFI